MPRPGDPNPGAGLAPPLSEVPWSSGIVAQAVEVLIVHLDGSTIRRLDPIHAPSIMVGLPVDRDPASIVDGVVRRYGLEPRAIHSTSWRRLDGHVVLTYLAVVADPVEENPYLRARAPDRTELARGSATAAPDSIAIDQVTEHALRHLAWLVQDDHAIADALPEWARALEGYLPEPFRGL